MYAIVSTGGKQFKVEENQIIKVEKLEAEKGDKVKLDVLMIADGDKVVTGNPIAKAYAEAEVLFQDKFDKIVVYKYKAKKNERRRQGHRQPYTAVKILKLEAK
jgi:large subunit ribosomal protein L21